MDINGTNSGASTYAMKKAIEMPKLMIDLMQQIPGSQSLNSEISAAKEATDPADTTGKGGIIDIIA